MESTILDNDIEVMYVTAKSFPDGVLEAHQELNALFPFSTSRKYFGLSRPEYGTIVYKAAAELTEPGEAEKFALDTLTIKKGKYVTVTIKDFMKDVRGIEQAFKKLIALPGIDQNGYCVEWYLDKDVQCMIRLSE